MTSLDPSMLPAEAAPLSSEQIISLADKTVTKIPLLWGLDGFVAVNPFWGLRDRPFAEATYELFRYSSRATLHPEHFDGRNVSQTEALARTFAAVAPIPLGESASTIIQHELSRFLALYYDRGQAALPSPLAQLGLWDAWRKFATTDRTLEFLGWRNSRQFFAQQENTPELVLNSFAQFVASLTVGTHRVPPLGEEELAGWFGSLLFSLPGWSGYLAHLDFEEMRDTAAVLTPRTRTLLAIIAAYQLLAAQQVVDRSLLSTVRNNIRNLSSDLVRSEYQQACSSTVASLEKAESDIAMRARALLLPSPGILPVGRPEIQALFCIDVRSEPIRRALELQSSQLETYGFAGFFGLPLSFRPAGSTRATSQHPVLLRSQFEVTEIECCDESTNTEKCNTPHSVQQDLSIKARAYFSFTLLVRLLRQSVSSGFSFVASLGPLYCAKMLHHTLSHGQRRERSYSKEKPSVLCMSLSTAERISFAKNILKNAALRSPYAPIVLICGHHSRSENNPYAASLDCGACGGRPGGVNAQVAALILNDGAVRAALKDSELEIPSDTQFVPALHNTTTDEMQLLHAAGALSAETHHELSLLLRGATSHARQERLGQLVAISNDEHKSCKEAHQRGTDWSEIRPEWGLARNALFIAARRGRTREQDFNARAFLHEYDQSLDPDGKTLELVMTAPLLVGSWINLQYLGSALIPELFSSGLKQLHNVVGQLGTVLGSGGDLGLGLPRQSTHLGNTLFHEPLRLQAIIEASPESIERVLSKHEMIRQLVENEWIGLYALSPTSLTLYRRTGERQWDELVG